MTWGPLLLLALSVSSNGCAPTVLDLARKIPHTKAEWTPPHGDSMAAALADLEARVEGWGIEVRYVYDLRNQDEKSPTYGLPAYGTWLPREALLLIADGFEINARFEILAHEVAHILQPRLIDEATSQVFAEVVAVAIAKHYGFDTRLSHAPWLADRKHAFSAIPDLKVDIDLAVKAATGKVSVRFILPRGTGRP